MLGPKLSTLSSGGQAMHKKLSFVLSLLLSALSIVAQQYIPIVLVHGVMSDDYGMQPTEEYIRKHMGDDVYIKNIQLGFGEVTSLTNVYYQAEYLREAIQTDPKLKDGFNFVVHSQGGLVSRYYLEKYNNPQVLTYISWGSPQQGIFGTPGTLDARFKWLDYMEGYAHHIMYSWGFQRYVGFAGYWHDSLHYEKYLAKASFLPYVNNEVDHDDAALFKKNICSLKNMIVVMSTKEEIVEPRESCHFGFYKPGSKTEMMPLFDTEMYKEDTLGLRTLYESGRLHLRIADCTHSNFQEDEKNFIENGLEYLKADPNNVPLNKDAVAQAQI